MNTSKEEFFHKVCNSVLKMEELKGHLLWRISDIAKDAKVQRTLIYHYFGKDREELLHEAWNYMLKTMFFLEEEQSLGVRARMKQIMEKIKEMPYLFVLFFIEKNKTSEIGEMIRTHEKKLISILSEKYPDLSQKEILEIYLLELGAIAHGNLTEEEIADYFPE